CIAASCRGNTLNQAVSTIPQLLKTVEKVFTQSHQPSVISEALTATLILIQLGQSDVEIDSKLRSFWDCVFDSKSQIFTATKFLSSVTEVVFHQLHLILEKLMSHPDEKIGVENASWWFSGLVFTLTHQNYQTRQQAKSCFSKLCSLAEDGGIKLQMILLEKFRELLNSSEVTSSMLRKTEVVSDQKVENENTVNFSPRILASVLENIVTIPLKDRDDKKYAPSVMICVLEDAHHPLIASSNPTLWRDLTLQLKLNIEELIKNKDEILKMFVSSKNVKVLPALIRTLLIEAESIIFDDVMAYVIKTLRNSKFETVTDEEFGIFNTPEGVLYDQSRVMEIKEGERFQHHNMKRESKAYSYEEQLEELQLRKELMKKKISSENVEMTKKEREAMMAQLEKENEVRKRIEELDIEISHACLVAQTAVSTKAPSLRQHIPILLQSITSLFKSPLAAPRVLHVFITLGDIVFPKKIHYLGECITWLTLQLHQARCPLRLRWEEKYLAAGVERMINDLYNTTISSEESLKSARLGDEKELLMCTTFSFCFPMIRCILTNSALSVDVKERTMEVLAQHCRLRMREEDIDERYSETGPSNLPRAEMLRLLTEIIQHHSDSVTTSKIQRLGCVSMVELSKSSSGEEGCTIASDEEINVLLSSLYSSVSSLRYVAIQCLQALNLILPNMEQDSVEVHPVVQRVWTTRFDSDSETSKFADRLWNEMGYFVQEGLCRNLAQDVICDVDDIQESASLALCEAVKEHPSITDEILVQLIDVYKAKLKLPALKRDELGRIVGDKYPDRWKERRGIAKALRDMATLFTDDEVVKLFTFFVPTALGDCNEHVRGEMLKAALAAVNHLGKDNTSSLLEIFEEFFDKAPDSSSHDTIRQSVIILMGCLAKHLDKEDPKVHPIIDKLLSALSTPSQQVQEAVSNCLPPLVPAIKEEAPDIIKNLLTKLLDSTVYGERRGAAYGLASLVKGLGILSLKQQNIMSTLQDAIQDKKNYRHREGALFAFELLCHILGRLFEPYIVHVLPHLLLCFGDGNQFVRDATDDTARAMMRNLSAHGVKLVLPSLLKALTEDAWRTKTGSVELLGAMAYCAPKQLSSCLPNIVPRLIEVLTDSHIKVQKAAAQALKHIGSVIRNPEIQAISPVLLEALSDPTSKTTEALQVLLMTSFVHVIDAPSLAIIMPIIHRALESRSTETKKMAAQIIGNMYSLTDQKDLNPYLSSVMPGLKQALLDPVPEVRAVSARALGALVKELGEGNCSDLLPWLMETLISETSSVDRSGAAQGLSEVLCGLGFERLSQLMPDVISATERADIAAHIKEGYLMLYLYLPSTFGTEFTPFVGDIIPSILKGLSDESEFVRGTSLKAGQRIVSQYATTAIEVFLPQLEQGLFDDNWRIRISSIQLMGDLLYKISGVSGKMTTEGEEDDNFGTSHSNQAIIDCLGYERRNRVLSGLYMGRSDVSLPVRQAALHVWKVVVPNTPRVLREILSTLFSLLLGCLASTSLDKRQIAARTLGDLVRKLGERILPEIIPILERGLESNEAVERQGVCIGLSEIIGSTSREQVLLYVDSVIPTVRNALCDPLAEVRSCAAQTFNNLYKTIGVKAINDIIPILLVKLIDPDQHENTLDGLRQIMSVRSKEVLPFIIPQLIAAPVNTQALASMSSVAGDALTDHLSDILPALLRSISHVSSPDQQSQNLENSRTLILAIRNDSGTQIVLDVLMKYCKDETISIRKAALNLLHSYCTSTKADLSQYTPALLHSIISRFNDSDHEVVEISWNALNAVTKRLGPPEQIQHIPHVRRAIRYISDDLEDNYELPGFCLPKPKGITPLLPIFREGILNGAPDVKQDAAEGLGQVIKLTSALALKPSVVSITGPLIRILGDRFSWNVKVAVLQTLGLLLVKVGIVLKPFLPQLQTTFIKALNDPNKIVREQSSTALQHLVKLHSRVDPLFTELHNGIKNTEDNQIRETIEQALRGILFSVGNKMGDNVRQNLTQTLLSFQSHAEETIRIASAGCLGALARITPDDELTSLVKTDILVSDSTVEWTLRHGRCLTISALFYDCCERLIFLNLFETLLQLTNTLSSNDRIPICKTAIKCLGYAAVNCVKERDFPEEIIPSITKGIQHSSLDIQVLTCDAIYYISEKIHDIPVSFLKSTISGLLPLSKEKNTSLKFAAEMALVSLLKSGNDRFQKSLTSLDASTANILNEFYKKTIPRILERNDAVICELDDPFSSEL
ncbi:LOW QUALITY PROTEIN: eIF-2-alpha kinase activator GCN1-like, partial [Dendronephthya gigantea]|uniref:LOW QUALITY PROTEIN: eIF-2-alpha kinase activator GCN1-like n=1 Tax=Dendronephthya gigantea TaxID=151771 RepID=UPI00106D5BB4